MRDSHAWVDHADGETVMTTAAEFREFQFAIEAPCGREHAAFLGSLVLGWVAMMSRRSLRMGMCSSGIPWLTGTGKLRRVQGGGDY